MATVIGMTLLLIGTIACSQPNGNGNSNTGNNNGNNTNSANSKYIGSWVQVLGNGEGLKLVIDSSNITEYDFDGATLKWEKIFKTSYKADNASIKAGGIEFFYGEDDDGPVLYGEANGQYFYLRKE